MCHHTLCLFWLTFMLWCSWTVCCLCVCGSCWWSHSIWHGSSLSDNMNQSRPNSHDTQHDNISTALKYNPKGNGSTCRTYIQRIYYELTSGTTNIKHYAPLLCIVVVILRSHVWQTRRTISIFIRQMNLVDKINWVKRSSQAGWLANSST